MITKSCFSKVIFAFFMSLGFFVISRGEVTHAVAD